MPAVSEKLTATLRALSMLAGVEPQADGGGGSASKVGGSAPKGKGKEGSNDVEWSAKKEARFHQQLEVKRKKIFEGVPFVKCKVPVQKNGYDCGMFVNRYAEMVLRKLPTSTLADIDSKFSTLLPADEFTQEDIFQEREALRELLARIKVQYDERCRLEGEDVYVDMEDSSMSEEEVESAEEEEEYVGVGFLNEDGSSCYINCTLQCLVHTTTLTAALGDGEGRGDGASVLESFRHLVSNVKLQHFSGTYTPLKVLGMGLLKPETQQDAHEYLILLLERVAQVSSIFLGSLLDTKTCSYVDTHVGVTPNPFNHLSLDISSNIKSVPLAIEAFLSAERLTDGNEWECSECHELTRRGKKQLSVSHAPDVLVLHLKRSAVTVRGARYKLLNWVQFGVELVLGGYTYELYAVIEHVGLNTQSGHYLAYVKAANGKVPKPHPCYTN
ncbi:hypothetical protein B484DRAFT_473582 [Ochromonadaceae sp. CCMP2298]|nr:hypothetical protein B484DRAFT_473582 [Ochromonadaceae sp. CCMP2298]